MLGKHLCTRVWWSSSNVIIGGRQTARHLSSSPSPICSSFLSRTHSGATLTGPSKAYVYRRKDWLPTTSCLSATRSMSTNELNKSKLDETLNIKVGDEAKTMEQMEIEKEDEEREQKRAKQKRYTRYTLMGMVAALTGSAVYAFFEWGKPVLDENGQPVRDEYSDRPFFLQYATRAWGTLTHYEKVLKEPTRELLLPPPLPAPYYQPPFTLVLEMTDVLVHPEWTYKTGWRFKKRPFVDYFLHQLATSGNFEIVVYTHEQGFTAFPLLNNLDPNGYIMYRLFKDSTRYENGVHIKDLNCLNRELKKVVHIDWDAKACQMNPDNCFRLKKWDGNSDDRTLYDLTSFLLAIANERVEDVREVIRYYSQFDDPLAAFRDNQRKLAEKERQLDEQRQQQLQQKKSGVKSILDSFRKK